MPAVFVCNGVVYDVQTRYHGSRYRRSSGLDSWKVTFPSYQLFEKKQRILITEKVSDNLLGYTLFHEAGLPAAYARYVDFFRNNGAGIQRCEITDNDEETLKRYQDELKDANPQNPPVFNGLGVIYKAKGLGPTDGTGGGPDEGPYGVANGQLMPARSVWSTLDRYIWVYPIQNNDWKGHQPLKSMLDQLWAARGDSNLSVYPSTYNGQIYTNQTPGKCKPHELASVSQRQLGRGQDAELPGDP